MNRVGLEDIHLRVLVQLLAQLDSILWYNIFVSSRSPIYLLGAEIMDSLTISHIQVQKEENFDHLPLQLYGNRRKLQRCDMGFESLDEVFSTHSLTCKPKKFGPLIFLIIICEDFMQQCN